MTISTGAPPRALSLQSKLLGAFAVGLIVVLLCALTGLVSAWWNLSTELPPQVNRNAQADTMRQDFRLQVQEWKNVLIRGSDDALRAKHLAAFDKQGEQVATAARALADTVDDAQASTLAKQFGEQHQQLQRNYHAALGEFEASGYNTLAGDALVRGMDRELGTTLDALSARTAELAANAVSDRSQQARKTLVVCAVLTVLAAGLLMLGLGWWLRRAIVAPVLATADAARAVARGDLDHVVQVTSRDEIGQLGEAMRDAMRMLKGVLGAQATMTDMHERGNISYRMDPTAFPGGYGQMMRDSNEIVNAHIQIKMRTIEVISHYANGDLSPDMDRLPGEKAIITNTLDTAKRNLGAINDEIKRLANAAAAGDFSQRGDEARYQHDFRDMINGLNRLMQTTEHDLADVSTLLQAIARGDLTARMHGEYHGVFARMRDDANRTATQLTQIVGGIQESAAAIRNAAGEIASGNHDLSQRTEQQAANLEETAASMEELTSTVRQNAEHARQANQLAIGAAGVASKGGDVVSRVVTTMSAIETSSRRIADIISVIDGIAFQTNILALNAAVEAARAGEQGRGFAVVASEVRTLAQRSAGAAKEIKDLIASSVSSVADGAELVRQAGDTMGEIVSSVQRVTTIMADIAAASQEQSSGIEQVNQTVVQMDETTQQNAALVEEASAAARSMEEQAQALNAAVAVFVLEDQGRHHHRQAA